MIKRILLITLLLIPMHASAHEWDFHAWLEKSVENDYSLADCYTYLIDHEYDTFMADCDIHTNAMEYEDLMSEFYSERDINHPGTSDTNYITDHYDGILLSRIQRNFRLQDKVKVAIMTLLLAENMLYNHK